MQIAGQQAFDDGDTEHIPGALRDRSGAVRGKIVVIVPTATGCEVMCPPGIVSKIHRVVDGKVSINLTLDLSQV